MHDLVFYNTLKMPLLVIQNSDYDEVLDSDVGRMSIIFLLHFCKVLSLPWDLLCVPVLQQVL